MRKSLLLLSLVGAAVAPSLAHANCHQRKVTGTVVGALGGGLIGGAASHNAGWGLLGAGLGAVAGHEIAGAGCRDVAYYHRSHYSRRAYYRRRYYDHGYAYRRASYDRADADRAAYETPYPAGATGAPGAYAQRCQATSQAYFDANGQLIDRPTRFCS